MKYLMLLISVFPFSLSAGNEFEWVGNSSLELPDEKYDAVDVDDYILLRPKAPMAQLPVLDFEDADEADEAEVLKTKSDFKTMWKPFCAFAKNQFINQMNTLRVNFHRAMEEFLEDD